MMELSDKEFKTDTVNGISSLKENIHLTNDRWGFSTKKWLFKK